MHDCKSKSKGFLAFKFTIKGPERKKQVLFMGQIGLYTKLKKTTRRFNGGTSMKGYYTDNGYMGYVGGRYQLFASEMDYREWMEN